jgi:TatD DNase family protein
VGLHPHDATNGVGTVRALFDDPRCRAVGECGLDYYYDHSPHDVQREAFAQQIAIANERDLPLIVHSRDAWDDTFAVLDANGVPKHTIFHCFTGGPAEARLAIDRGAYLSFSGIVSFKAADDLRAAAAMCPADRLLVETDSPYLAPVPHRGQMNEPAYLPDVGAALAAARNAEVEHVAELTLQNFLTVFGVSDGAS